MPRVKRPNRFELGDKVRIKRTGLEGHIVGISFQIRTADAKGPEKPKKYRVRVGNMYRVNLLASDLERI